MHSKHPLIILHLAQTNDLQLECVVPKIQNFYDWHIWFYYLKSFETAIDIYPPLVEKTKAVNVVITFDLKLILLVYHYFTIVGSK